MTPGRLIVTAILASASTAVLAGCMAGGPLTVPAALVASQAEDIMEDTVGARPVIDCGDDRIDLINGTDVDCVLTDPATGIRYSADITISEVDGDNYKLNVVGGSEPLD